MSPTDHGFAGLIGLGIGEEFGGAGAPVVEELRGLIFGRGARGMSGGVEFHDGAKWLSLGVCAGEGDRFLEGEGKVGIFLED